MAIEVAVLGIVGAFLIGIGIGFWFGSMNDEAKGWIVPQTYATKKRGAWKRRPRPQSPGHSQFYIQLNENCEITVQDSPHPAYKGWYINAVIGEHYFKDEEIAAAMEREFVRPTTVEEAKEIGESFVPWCVDKIEELYPTPQPIEAKVD